MNGLKGYGPARGAKAACLGAIVFASLAALPAPASAQFFGGWFGPPRPVYVEPGPVIPPRLVASILRAQGFRLTDLPARSGDRIIALGADERGQVMRFVLDARDGTVIRTALVGAPRPPGYVGRDRETLAYGAVPLPGEPDVFNEAPPLVKPKAKPKTKTAAKPAAAPPLETTATVPTLPPSQATRAPTQPAVVVAPTLPAAAPERARLAPDSQPGDIGPKVVPVKPTEARAPIEAPETTAPVVNAPVVTAPVTAEPVATPPTEPIKAVD